MARAARDRRRSSRAADRGTRHRLASVDVSEAPPGIHRPEVTEWMCAHVPEITPPLTFTLIAGDSIINAVSTASVCVQSGPVDCGGSLPDAGP